MKNQRQEKIKELISHFVIETQDELIEHLEREGFRTTQATVSRDIRELKISKVLGKNGKYHYNITDGGVVSGIWNPYSGSVVGVDCADNLVIIKTHPGMAQAVAAGIDSMKEWEILGSVAGDDTIIAVARDKNNAVGFCESMKKMTGIV